MNYQSLASWVKPTNKYNEILESRDYFWVKAVDPLRKKIFYANVLGLAMVGMGHSVEAAVMARNKHRSTETVKIAADVFQILIFLAIIVYWRKAEAPLWI